MLLLCDHLVSSSNQEYIIFISFISQAPFSKDLKHLTIKYREMEIKFTQHRKFHLVTMLNLFQSRLEGNQILGASGLF